MYLSPNSPRVYVFTDSEWLGDIPADWQDHPGSEKVYNMFIGTQCRYTINGETHNVSFISDRHYFSECDTAALNAGFDYSIIVSREDIANGLVTLLPRIDPRLSIVPVMFYSPIDLAYFIGVDRFLAEVKSKNVTKMRAHRLEKPIIIGDYKVMAVKDLKGLSPGSAESAAASVGFDTVDKAVSKTWNKGRMDIVLKDHTYDYMRYALWDVEWMEYFSVKFPELVNTIRDELWNLPPISFDEMPSTIGSLVARSFQDWLNTQVPNLHELQVKMGRLRPDARVNSKEYEKLSAKYWDGVIDGCSVQTIASKPGSIKYSAIVLGGRAVNERPMHPIHRGRIADIDLKSCYGSALAGFTYPIGIPSIYGGVRDDEALSLREWLKRYEAELVPGLWTANLQGKLPHGQNILFSKRVKQQDLLKAGIGTFDDDDDDDPSKIPGTFALATHFIENGVLTDEVLKVIKAVSTEREWSDFLSLNVVSAVWYSRKNMATDPEGFSAELLKNPGRLELSRDGKGLVEDTRNRTWLGVPIGGFIQPLVDKRNAIKNTGNKPLDTALKLFVNTLYGDIASPYFSIGNTVVANNITGKARVGAWMMAMALGSFQSITDGGAYNLDEVRFLNANASQFKRPGMRVFQALSWDGVDNRVLDAEKWITKPCYGRTIGTLQVDWEGATPWEDKTTAKAYSQALDIAAMNHINTFFAPYGLELPFNIEHKAENFATDWVTTGKADYSYLNLNGEVKYKVRGAIDYDASENMRRNPRFSILDALRQGTKYTGSMTHDTKKLLSVNSYHTLKYENQVVTYPGLEIRGEAVYAINCGHFPLPSIDAHELWANTASKKKRPDLNEWAVEPEKFPHRASQLLNGKRKQHIK